MPSNKKWGTVPVDLCRVVNKQGLKLRDRNALSPQEREYDVITKDGFVQPRATIEGQANYEGPNGALVERAGFEARKKVAENYGGEEVQVWVVEKGTRLPVSLVLVKVDKDHYSFEPTVRIKLEDKNTAIDTIVTTGWGGILHPLYQSVPQGFKNGLDLALDKAFRAADRDGIARPSASSPYFNSNNEVVRGDKDDHDGGSSSK
ncbi:hypothetical protein F5Y17DRAFT_461976 [Xylariaceae sp. FL0594]|nr:hypothetical protein F5Y17DRAFT_461976 [Xylariaceae sp. FL0594]